mmetsp:Transcript_28247/g.65962  ORF Transcript_28247/g.65962 Transcript_28247/m.65962 type:complete len:89 (+) Transcript_28247:159-425(+)
MGVLMSSEMDTQVLSVLPPARQCLSSVAALSVSAKICLRLPLLRCSRRPPGSESTPRRLTLPECALWAEQPHWAPCLVLEQHWLVQPA